MLLLYAAIIAATQFLPYLDSVAARTIDCIYVRRLTSASRVSDELSTEVIVRGIENPVARTCYLHIAMRPVDWLMLLLGLGAIAGALVCGAVA